jgi:FkbM family methyltransferase
LRIVNRSIQAMLALLGVKLVRLGGPADRSTMENGLRALGARKHAVRTVIDIGASNGSWSELLMPHFPICQYLLIEALSVHESALRDYCQRYANAQFVLAAAGERPGRTFFATGDDPFGGGASATPAAGGVEVPVVTIDAEVAARRLPGPYLLKFDTHGFEVPILRGAAQTLRDTEVIVMECYNFRISPDALTFDEMCRYLGERGFRCLDLIEPLYRPYDNSFWQADLVFVRDNRPEFSYQGYR